MAGLEESVQLLCLSHHLMNVHHLKCPVGAVLDQGEVFEIRRFSLFVFSFQERFAKGRLGGSVS